MDQNPYNNISKELKNSSLYTVKLINTPKKFKTIRNWLAGIFFIFFLCLFLPWQQNINGKGKVTPFAPEDRPQNIPSIIAGRIESWKVVEGQFVKKGDTLVIISEVKEKFFDPQLLTRTEGQINNKIDGLAAKNRKILALEKQIDALKSSVSIKLKMAKNKVLQNEFAVKAEKGNYDAAIVNEILAKNQFERLNELYKKGLASLTEIQNRTSKKQEAKSKMIEAENKFNKAENELINARIDLNFIEAEYIDKISKAESVLEETAGELFESQADLIKLKIEYSNLQLRSGFYAIKAPQDGYLVQVMKAGIGEIIKDTDIVKEKNVEIAKSKGVEILPESNEEQQILLALLIKKGVCSLAELTKELNTKQKTDFDKDSVKNILSKMNVEYADKKETKVRLKPPALFDTIN